MTTEATAAPAPVETTATAAPTEGATTTAAANPALAGLAEAVAGYQERRARVMGTQPPAANKDAPAASAAAKVEGEKPAESKTDPSKPAEPAKEAPKPDEVSEGMVRILRQQRAMDRQRREVAAEKSAAEAERAAIAAERTQHAQQLEAARKFEETRKKDPVAATMELLGKDALAGTFPLDLINRLAEQEGPPTPEQIAEIATAKAEANIRAKMAEEAKAKKAEDLEAKTAAEAARAADLETKKTAFFTGLAHQLKTDVDKYPYLVAKPVGWDEVDQFVVGTFNRTGKPPLPEEIFKHFDGEREKDAAALAAIYNKRNTKTAPTAPAPKTSTARASTEAPRDTRGRVETPTEGETQRQRLERVARELNNAFPR
jgi:hypothetical protein